MRWLERGLVWRGSEPLRRRVGELWAAMDANGRPRDAIEISAGLFVVPGRQDNRVSALALCGEVDEIAEGLRAYEKAGTQHVVLSLATVPFRLQQASFIEWVARAFGRPGAERAAGPQIVGGEFGMRFDTTPPEETDA